MNLALSMTTISFFIGVPLVKKIKPNYSGHDGGLSTRTRAFLSAVSRRAS